MKQFTFLLIALMTVQLAIAQTYKLNSPDNNIRVEITAKNGLSWKLFYKEKPVITDAQIALFNKNLFPTKGDKVSKKYRKNVKEVITAHVPTKFKSLETEYNSLTLTYKNKNSVEFRLYNEGLAYRININYKGDVEIDNEKLKFSMPESTSTFFPEARRKKYDFSLRAFVS